MTGVVYDEAYLTHGDPHHPENGKRLTAAVSYLREGGLWDEMTPVPARPATEAEVTWVHREDYLEEVEAVCAAGGGYLDHDTRVTKESYDVALLAAGGCVAAAEALFLGQIQNAICLIRPPGHHALPSRGMGFCVFNNVAIAAEVALRRAHRDNITIVDWDVHHGNGTQEAYYDRSDVQYISIHQCPFYPGTGSLDDVGVDAGLGKTVNLPLPPGAEDTHYRLAFRELVVPLIEAYETEAILVSCGFDTHYADPLAAMCLTNTGFYDMTRLLMEVAEELCQGRLMVVLEGGYDLDAVALGTEAVCLALMGMEPPEPEAMPLRVHPAVTHEVERWLQHGIATHRERLLQ